MFPCNPCLARQLCSCDFIRKIGDCGEPLRRGLYARAVFSRRFWWGPLGSGATLEQTTSWAVAAAAAAVSSAWVYGERQTTRILTPSQQVSYRSTSRRRGAPLARTENVPDWNSRGFVETADEKKIRCHLGTGGRVLCDVSLGARSVHAAGLYPIILGRNAWDGPVTSLC